MWDGIPLYISPKGSIKSDGHSSSLPGLPRSTRSVCLLKIGKRRIEIPGTDLVVVIWSSMASRQVAIVVCCSPPRFPPFNDYPPPSLHLYYPLHSCVTFLSLVSLYLPHPPRPCFISKTNSFPSLLLSRQLRSVTMEIAFTVHWD